MELITVVSGQDAKGQKYSCRSSAAAHNHVGSEVQLDLDSGKLIVVVKEPLGAGRWHVAGDLEIVPGSENDCSITLHPSAEAVINGFGYGEVKFVHVLPHDSDYAGIEVKVRIRDKNDKSWHPNTIKKVNNKPTETKSVEAALAKLITMARQHASGEKVLGANDLAQAILACTGKK